jgi:tetratricopeptide (TPR) repeat protein
MHASAPPPAVPVAPAVPPGAQKPHLAAPKPGSAPEARKMLDDAARLLRDRHAPEAERLFQKVFDTSKGVADRANAATGLARVAFEQGHFPDAVSRGERAVRIGGGLPAHLLLGDAYLKVNRKGEAAREYREVLRLKPDHVEAKRRLDIALAHTTGG